MRLILNIKPSELDCLLHKMTRCIWPSKYSPQKLVSKHNNYMSMKVRPKMLTDDDHINYLLYFHVSSSTSLKTLLG